jgi:hypothetical protein
LGDSPGQPRGHACLQGRTLRGRRQAFAYVSPRWTGRVGRAARPFDRIVMDTRAFWWRVIGTHSWVRGSMADQAGRSLGAHLFFQHEGTKHTKTMYDGGDGRPILGLSPSGGGVRDGSIKNGGVPQQGPPRSPGDRGAAATGIDLSPRPSCPPIHSRNSRSVGRYAGTTLSWRQPPSWPSCLRVEKCSRAAQSKAPRWISVFNR